MSYHRAWNATHCSKELEVFARRQQIKEDVVLRTNPGHAAYRSHVVGIAHIVAEYKGGAGCRCGQAREDVKESGLTSAVVTKDGGDLTFVDSKIDAVHCLDFWMPALVERLIELGYPDRFAAFHLAHHWLHIAIRLLTRNERIRLAVRWRHLQIFLWKRRDTSTSIIYRQLISLLLKGKKNNSINKEVIDSLEYLHTFFKFFRTFILFLKGFVQSVHQ